MPPSSLTHASSRAITRPPCSKCGAAMVLARIEPHTPGYDMRTSERPACGRSESAVVHFGGLLRYLSGHHEVDATCLSDSRLGLIVAVVRLRRNSQAARTSEAAARISSHDHQLWICTWNPGILDTSLRLAERLVCNPDGAKRSLRRVRQRIDLSAPSRSTPSSEAYSS